MKKKLPKIEHTSEYIHCPLLKCGGFRATAVCWYLKCKRYKLATCPSVLAQYKEHGYERQEAGKKVSKKRSSRVARKQKNVVHQGDSPGEREQLKLNERGAEATA